MTQKSAVSVVALLAFIFCSLVAGAAANPQFEGRMAVALVIDASGSMVYNDPDRMRVDAACRMVDILKDEDSLAALEFSTEVRPLVPLRIVGGDAGREDIATLIAGAGQGGDTNILGALRSAFQTLEGAPEGARKFAILLSDGESDVPGVTNSAAGREQYFADTETLLAQYREKGWAVHCIAFHEAGAATELSNIAGKTGGEYQFVTDAGDLKNIFANILLAAKYPLGVQPVFHANLLERDGYRIGESLTAEAYITIGEDRVLLGPYLELTGMNLVLSQAGSDPVVVPFEEAEDGLFRAEIELDKAAEFETMASVTARYRGQEIGESVDLGAVTAAERVRMPLVTVDTEQARSVVFYLSFGAGFVALVTVTFLLWRLRLRERVGGELRIFVTRNQEVRYTKDRLKLGKARKSEVQISTAADDRDVHFVMDPLDREFAFIIRTRRDPVLDPKLSKLQRIVKGPEMLYEVIALPGTAIQIADRLRTRSDLYHGDIFEVGGYAFEFHLPFLGERPGGENVLNSYSSLMRDKPGRTKGKKVISLRLERDK